MSSTSIWLNAASPYGSPSDRFSFDALALVCKLRCPPKLVIHDATHYSCQEGKYNELCKDVMLMYEEQSILVRKPGLVTWLLWVILTAIGGALAINVVFFLERVWE